MSTPCVLIVDDQLMIRHLLQSILIGKGYTVIAASNGKEAIKVFSDHCVDAVLLDVIMPVMDGFDTCKEMRQMSGVPIIMVSVLSGKEDIDHALSVGADGYITKPFTAKVVCSKLDELLHP